MIMIINSFFTLFRYYISTKNSLIRLYVDKPYWEAFNVDGRRCENLLECEVKAFYEKLFKKRICKVKELTTGVDDCPHDFIKLHDGVDEYSPLIGQFCGVGSFPVSIIGTSNKLFLEFVTSKYGPLLNTGIIMVSVNSNTGEGNLASGLSLKSHPSPSHYTI